MKSFLFFVKVAIICTGFFLWGSGWAVAEREDWKVLQEDSYHNVFSYDNASVKRTAGNTITVSAKSNGAKYLYEIDCKNKKARTMEKPGPAESEWFAIVRGSGESLLYNALCP